MRIKEMYRTISLSLIDAKKEVNPMKVLLYILSALFFATTTWAHDFSFIAKDGNHYFFNIISPSKQQVEITYEGSITDPVRQVYSGKITLPHEVRFKNKNYQVCSIGEKAFAGMNYLEEVVIPSGIQSIGDFAFEDCSKLTRIILPGNQMRLGEGVFFRDTLIQHVTFGSDWIAIDFRIFRGNNRLKEVHIPAKVRHIEGLKSLKGLERITVDPNNAKFQAQDGVLYSKDTRMLYCCPRQYKNSLEVILGTTRIFPGAIEDCIHLKTIILPESMESFSFREFRNLGDLATVVIKNPVPPITAYQGTAKCFLLQVANPDLILVVHKKALKTYREVLIYSSGEYVGPEIIPGESRMPFVIKDNQMLIKKRIKGTIDFNNFKL